MEKTATLNLRVNPAVKERAETVLEQLGIPFEVSLPKAPDFINADLMTDKALYEKLKRGFDDAEAGRIQDARSAFVKFVEDHR